MADVVLGADNVTETTTTLHIDTNANTVLAVENGSSLGGIGVRARGNAIGVHAYSVSGQAVFGESVGGTGITGNGRVGVRGRSTTGTGVVADGLIGVDATGSSTGVRGSAQIEGVFGDSPYETGVLGKGGRYGVRGYSNSNIGVAGESDNGNGVEGRGARIGVWGHSPMHVGVRGSSDSGTGVFGRGDVGVRGVGLREQGVYGESEGSAGVRGVSKYSNGVTGTTNAARASGVYGHSDHGGFGVAGRSNAEKYSENSVPAAAVFGDNVADGVGVLGHSASGPGVLGKGSIGVRGISVQGAGVEGASRSGNGVSGTAEDYRSAGVHGANRAGNGVSGASEHPRASGVYGHNERGGYGVAGRSNARALGQDGIYAAAVLGDNTADGVAVWAHSFEGIGLVAEAVSPDGIAIKAMGVTQFSRSGRGTIPKGESTFTVSGVRIDPESLVLATLQQDRGAIYVRSAVPTDFGNSFTITLNQRVPQDTVVGWFIVN